MSKKENPYKSLKTKTEYDKFLKKELVDLYDKVHNQERAIKVIDHLKDKQAILSDAAKTKSINLEQYRIISALLKKNPEKIDIIKEIQKYNKEYSKSTGKGIDSDIMGYLNQF